MKFGVYMFPADYAMHPAELAKAAEARGFDSLWFPEHTHIPASRISPWPGGGELPEEYSHTHDPFVALAAAAAVTKTIRLGTGIALVVERDPIVLAKEVASLDHVSGGRVDFGVGGGWNAEEMENHGVPFNRRWKVLRERVEAMKEIWTQEEASYEGEFVKFDKIWSWPKPIQKPHPPIWVGGTGETTLKRVVRYGDGWFPNRGVKVMGDKVKELHDMCAAAGRPPLPVTLFGCPPDPGVIEKMAGDGVTQCVFTLPPEGADKVLAAMDNAAKVVKQAA